MPSRPRRVHRGNSGHRAPFAGSAVKVRIPRCPCPAAQSRGRPVNALDAPERPLAFPEREITVNVEAAEPHHWSAAPLPAGTSRVRSRGGLEVVPGGNRAARDGSPTPGHNPPDTPAGDGSVPRAQLLRAAALLLLQVIADDPPGDPDATALAAELAGLLGE